VYTDFWAGQLPPVGIEKVRDALTGAGQRGTADNEHGQHDVWKCRREIRHLTHSTRTARVIAV